MFRGFTLFIFLMILATFAFAEYEALYPNFSSIEESKAYKRLMLRNEINDPAKLHYLIDRFANSEVQIRYDGNLYPPMVAAQVARWFLAARYQNQTPKEWVNQYCNKSIMTDEPIWVKLPDGSLKRSREVLLNEIQGLEQVLSGSPLKGSEPGL